MRCRFRALVLGDHSDFARLGLRMRRAWQVTTVTAIDQTPERVSRRDDDPVPPGLVLNLEEAFRVLEALEDARLAMRESGLAPGLQDELATVIRIIHGRLGFEEGGGL